jgi:hypothetical protein
MTALDVCFARHIGPEDGQAHWADPELADDQEIELALGLRASRLTEDLREKIAAACHEQGYGYRTPPGGPVLSYGLVRDDAPETEWDADGKLRSLVALSRLIHPSTLGLDYCATVSLDKDGTVRHIRGVAGAPAYKLKRHRPWLTPKDLEDLGGLFGAHEALPVQPEPRNLLVNAYALPQGSRKLPVLLHRAMWNTDYAARVQPAHLRWLIVAATAEGLAQTKKDKARRQFVTRIPAISAELGAPIPKSQAERTYDLRCEVAHSGWLQPGRSDDELDDSLEPLQGFVAGVLKRAIMDKAFRDVFETRETIAKRWPI